MCSRVPLAVDEHLHPGVAHDLRAVRQCRGRAAVLELELEHDKRVGFVGAHHAATRGCVRGLKRPASGTMFLMNEPLASYSS